MVENGTGMGKSKQKPRTEICLAWLRTVRINRAKVECMKNKKEYKRSCVADS